MPTFRAALGNLNNYPLNEGPMPAHLSYRQPNARAALALALFCSGLSCPAARDERQHDLGRSPIPPNTISTSAKQLEPERKNLATRSAELQGLMSEGRNRRRRTVVAELAIATNTSRCVASRNWRGSLAQEQVPGRKARSEG